jgi:hypothetical protein
MTNLFLTVIKEKCPFCDKGDVFKQGKFWQMPEMNSKCSNCKKDFTGEPGYYFGAMYVSYAIAVGIGIGTFLFCRLILGTESSFIIIGACVGNIFLISVKNYKWSRILWLKIFPPGAGTNFELKKSK